MQKLSRRSELTFKANLQNGRHGWLRLTPAYAATLVEQLLEGNPVGAKVLDPFAGTGTTGLVCAEHGVQCDMVEINPFLAWLAQAKVRNYSPTQTELAAQLAHQAVQCCKAHLCTPPDWLPPMRHIERWWTPSRLHILAHLFNSIGTVCQSEPDAVRDLLLIAFCQVMMRWSNAGYHHPSITFRTAETNLFDQEETHLILDEFLIVASRICMHATQPLRGRAEVFLDDARTLTCLDSRMYDVVITSPPYPNRISYVREVRPFLYWLGFLTDSRAAGELDWKAIGGTWGIATSRLLSIELNDPLLYTLLPDLHPILQAIDQHSALLSRYVLRYFQDMRVHFENLSRRLRPNAQIHYIVGNAKFYEVVVPVETLLAHLMRAAGFETIKIEPLRKRNSKRELVEFRFSGIKR
jgi:hypothetical protein